MTLRPAFQYSGKRGHSLFQNHGYCSRLRQRLSIENHGLLAVDQNAVLGMETKRLGQHKTLKIAPFSDKILKRILVADPHDILFDNRPLVELFGHIVARGTDNLGPVHKPADMDCCRQMPAEKSGGC